MTAGRTITTVFLLNSLKLDNKSLLLPVECAS